MVDGVPVSIRSCVFGAVSFPGLLLFCRSVEKEPVRSRLAPPLLWNK